MVDAPSRRQRRRAQREPRPSPDPALTRRVVIEGVTPEVNEGRFPAKATLGEDVIVEADIFTDGTDVICAELRYRADGERAWAAVPMEPLVNDRWRARFPVDHLGDYLFTIEAWTDPFLSWRRDLQKRLDAGQDVGVELQIGAQLVAEAVKRAAGRARQTLSGTAARLAGGGPQSRLAAIALDEDLAALMAAHADRSHSTLYHREVRVRVDPASARFSTWYEMFPRSRWSTDPVGQSPRSGPGFPAPSAQAPAHATFRDVESRLPYIADMGFDVLYLPPIHPIGRTHRKGANNSPTAKPGDPGSPWAIGSEEGGHKAVHPALGTLEDFRRLVRLARDEYGIEVALDIAFQCSPDHPYVREHPEWFRHRPDGSIQYAENPPKKYEDIYPFDFQTDAWPALWAELKSIVDFWIDQGVRMFRVDNPHTKPFAFWEWLLAEVRRQHPEVIFLSEAFTRPKIMYRLGKLGFQQSYTYFAWRNHKWELTQYLTELTSSPVRDFFRPNFWPNTPDILTEVLQQGGRPAFVARLVLAATMSSSYGIYGPAFELMVHEPREPGSEEYLNSEKYELKYWDVLDPNSLRDLIAVVNRIRRQNPALQTNRNLRFLDVDNDHLIAYAKRTDDGANAVLTVVNVDYRFTQSGWVDVDAEYFGLTPAEPFEVHDLLADARYTWHPGRNFVKLDPQVIPAHVFVIHRLSHAKPSEQD